MMMMMTISIAFSAPSASRSTDVDSVELLVAFDGIDDVHQRVPLLLLVGALLLRLRREVQEFGEGGIAVAIHVRLGHDLLRELGGILLVKLPVKELLHLSLGDNIVLVLVHPTENSCGDPLVIAVELFNVGFHS